MSSPIREAFLSRLETKLYNYLKSMRLFGDWDTAEIYQLASSLVQDQKKRINEYLDEHEYTVAESEKAADLIIKEFFIPMIEKLKI